MKQRIELKTYVPRVFIPYMVKWARGPKSALKSRTIQHDLQLTDTQIRACVRHAVMNHGKKIIGTRQGFYCTTNKVAIQKAVASLRERAAKVLKRAVQLERRLNQ